MRHGTEPARSKIAITGANGFIGKALSQHLHGRGHTVIRLRRGDGAGETWDPGSGKVDQSVVDGCDAFIHLAGESIAGRWTSKKKSAIRDSRIAPTALLMPLLAQLPHPPRALLCASGVGYYGDRGDAVLTEDSSCGVGFLPQVCRDWENATYAANMRIVQLRLGMVLSNRGGALKAMLMPFQLGLGGVIGNGSQWWSWIALSDLLRAVEHILARDEIVGAVNMVTPEPVTNREFTRYLSTALHRPTLLPLPAPLLKLMLGEAADELLLYSARVSPSRLQESGFAFEYPTLPKAFAAILKG